MNPYPCGWLNDAQKACGCASAVIPKYQKRISGAILDRIDIHIEIPRVDYEKLSGDRVGRRANLFVLACKLRVTYKPDASPTTGHRTPNATLICAWGRSGNIANFLKTGRA
jgi:hypothetical protein